MDAPQFFKTALATIRKLNRSLSRKKAGSANRAKAKRLLARAQARIADKRREFHCKLAHALCKRYDFIFLEDLNRKHAVLVAKIGRFEPSTALSASITSR